MTKEKQVSGMEKDAKKKNEYRKIVDMAKYTQDMKSRDERRRMKSQISKSKMSNLQHKTKSPLPKNVKIAKEKADQFMKATKKGQKLGLKRQSKNKDLNKAEKRMRQAAASKPNLDFGEFRLVPSIDPHNPKIKGYRVRMKGTPEQNKLPDNDPKLGQMGLMSGLFVRKLGKDKPVTKEQAENMASNELNYDTTVINASYDELPMGVDFDTKKFDAKNFAKAMKNPNRVFDLSRDEVPLENTRFKNMGRHVVIPESTDLTNSVLNNVDVSELRHSDIKNSYVQNAKLIGVNNIDHSNLSLGVNAIVNGSTIKNSKLLNRTFKGNPDLINNSTIENSIFSMRDGGIAVGDSSLNHVTSIGPAEIEQSIIKAPKGNIVLNHPTISDRAIETKSPETVYVHNDSNARKVPVLSDNPKRQLNTAKNDRDPYSQRRMQEILQAKHDPDVQRAIKGQPIKMMRDPKMAERLKQEAKNMHIQPNLNGKDFDGDPKRELKRGDKVMNLKGEKGKAFKKGDKIMDTKGRKMEVGKDFDGDPKLMRDPMLEQMLKKFDEYQKLHVSSNNMPVHDADFDGDVTKAQRRTQDILQAKHNPDVQRALHDRDFDGDVTQDILQEKHNPDMQSRMKHIQNLLQAKHDPDVQNALHGKLNSKVDRAKHLQDIESFEMLDPSDYEHFHYGKPSAMPDLTRDVDVVNHAEDFAKSAEEHAIGVEMPFKSMDNSFNDAPNKQEHGDLGKQKEDDGPDIDFD